MRALWHFGGYGKRLLLTLSVFGGSIPPPPQGISKKKGQNGEDSSVNLRYLPIQITTL